MRILVYTKNGKPSKNAWDASWIGLYSCGSQPTSIIMIKVIISLTL